MTFEKQKKMRHDFSKIPNNWQSPVLITNEKEQKEIKKKLTTDYNMFATVK